MRLMIVLFLVLTSVGLHAKIVKKNYNDCTDLSYEYTVQYLEQLVGNNQNGKQVLFVDTDIKVHQESDEQIVFTVLVKSKFDGEIYGSWKLECNKNDSSEASVLDRTGCLSGSE